MQFQTNTNKKQGGSTTLILLVILFLVIFAGGGYFYYTYYMASPPGDEDTLVDHSATDAQTQTGEVGQINPPGADQTGDKEQDKKKTPPPKISGTNIGDLFIPSKLDIDSIEFLQDQINLGDLPIEVSEGMLGKNNPFLK
ncbi:MAG: hypothetical protein GF335_01130 [Candidatus Moranbacteria bacterium]|nr:hypothetical protein [Candidatus Moranbacteria bacterium]